MGTLWSQTIAILLCALAIAGGIYMIWKKDILNNFFLMAILANLVMIFAEKMSYSPSRHMIIFIPISIYYVIQGIEVIVNISKHVGRTVVKTCLIACYFCILIEFCVNFYSEYTMRCNKISENIVKEWIQRENPVFIGSDRFTLDFWLMNLDGYSHLRRGLLKEGKELEKGDTIVIYSRTEPVTQESLAPITEELGNLKLELVEAIENSSDIEVEYAYGVFANKGNGFFYYVYQVM